MTLEPVWFVSLFRGGSGGRRLLPPTWKLQEDLVQPEMFQPVIHESKFQVVASFRLIVLLFFLVAGTSLAGSFSAPEGGSFRSPPRSFSTS